MRIDDPTRTLRRYQQDGFSGADDYPPTLAEPLSEQGIDLAACARILNPAGDSPKTNFHHIRDSTWYVHT